MNLSFQQVRAARALVGLTLQEVAQLAGVSKNGLSDLEQGKVNPRLQTLAKLRRVFESHGVEFIESDGVRLRSDVFRVTSYEGKKSFIRYFQDLVLFMKQTGEKALHHSDDATFSKYCPDEFFWYYSQMEKNGLKERLLIPDNKVFRYPPYHITDCRLCPRDAFGTVGYSVYGSKFAIYVPDRMVVIENKQIADTYRRQFEFDWKHSKPMPLMPCVFDREKKRRAEKAFSRR